MVKDINKVFYNNNFQDSFGGTEQQVQYLLENVDNNLLKNFEWCVSYAPKDFKRKDKKTLYWLHDLPNDPYHIQTLSNQNFQDQFDYFIFVSYWQRNEFIHHYNLPYSKCKVLKNAIKPIENIPDKFNDKKLKLIYISAPHKGLLMVYEVFKEIFKDFGDKVELDVYSSYEFYGEAHEIRNKQYEELYKDLQEHPNVNYNKSISHEKVLEKLKESHIFLLPSLFPETYGISLVEAISAKCICVFNDIGATYESSHGFGSIFNYNEDINEHCSNFYERLKNTINLYISCRNDVKQYTELVKDIVEGMENWEVRTAQWKEFLEDI